MKVALIIDEASLIRLDVFQELHSPSSRGTPSPSSPLSSQGSPTSSTALFRTSQPPLASRIVAGSHLDGVNRQDMEHYLRHHLSISGVKKNLFDQAAVTAIHQGSGGLFRKANHLARGALIAAAKQQSTSVTPEHVRLASTELF